MPKYTEIYGVDCRNARILETDNYGARLQYQVKHSRKLQTIWLDYAMIFNSPALADLYRAYTKPCECQSCQALRTNK